MRRIADKAAEYLKSKGHEGTMYGDGWLLHEIAAFAGISPRGWKTEIQILNALDRAPDLFEKRYCKLPNGKRLRAYYLKL
jgi:hypothetical protein